jgi:Pyruvate/2-oxoacid:ferredoxin oxidoreductase delta subunit
MCMHPAVTAQTAMVPTHNLVCVGACPSDALDLIKDGPKQVRGVVGHLALQQQQQQHVKGCIIMSNVCPQHD